MPFTGRSQPLSLMKKALCCSAVILAALATSWWLAGEAAPEETFTTAGELLMRRKGPQDPAFCAPPAVPKPPPPVDSPFGVHLFASTPLGIVHPVRGVIETVDQLGLPESPASTEAPKDRNETAYDDVQSVHGLLEEFRRVFGAMPVGELNDEIVRRLQGENPRGLAVLPKTHPAINAQGELMDRWGTPYRFHPESSWEMNVRSAGPDRRMWTADDIVNQADSQVVLK